MQYHVPEIETNRLILKEITKADIPAYTRHFVDYEVIRNLSAAVPWPYPNDGVESYLTNVVWPVQGKGRWSWGLFLKTNQTELIGSVDIWENGCPENRGFWLGKRFWGNGYMTEAVIAVMDYAFSNLNFEKMILSNALGNEKSRRVKEKTGAKLLRTEPAKFVDSNLTTRELWEITKKDWFQFRLKK